MCRNCDEKGIDAAVCEVEKGGHFRAVQAFKYIGENDSKNIR